MYGLFQQEQFLESINIVINKGLNLDPEFKDKLRSFSGKVIEIEITDKINQKVFIQIQDDQFQFVSGNTIQSDTCISGSMVALTKMIFQKNVAILLLKGELEIKGDIRLGNSFKKLFSNLQLDWQQPLAGIIGDSATQAVEESLTKIKSLGRNNINSFLFTCSEYVQEESRDVVTETELEIFNQQVDDFRNDVERLEARLSNLI